MRNALIVTLLAACTLLPGNAKAEEDRIPIYINADCSSDSVGQRLVYKTREAIRASRRMYETLEYPKSLIQLQIVCLEPDRDEAGSVTRYAYAITAINIKGKFDHLINFGVGTCGTSRINECAESRTASTDESVAEVIASFRNGTFEFKQEK